MTRKWRPLETCFEAIFDAILFSFHKETGVQISMKLVAFVIYMREKIIGFMKLAYEILNANGGRIDPD